MSGASCALELLSLPPRRVSPARRLRALHLLAALSGWRGLGLWRRRRCAALEACSGHWLIVVQEEAERRMAGDDPLLKVPMTSELGNVTPVVIVPGAWASEEIRSAAQLVAFNMTDNAGCNCLAPKAVVLAAEWPQARRLLSRVTVAALPTCPDHMLHYGYVIIHTYMHAGLEAGAVPGAAAGGSLTVPLLLPPSACCRLAYKPVRMVGGATALCSALRPRQQASIH